MVICLRIFSDPFQYMAEQSEVHFGKTNLL